MLSAGNLRDGNNRFDGLSLRSGKVRFSQRRPIN